MAAILPSGETLVAASRTDFTVCSRSSSSPAVRLGQWVLMDEHDTEMVGEYRVLDLGHSLVGWSDPSPRTRLGDLVDEPPPLRFPDDHLPVDAADDGGVVNDRIVVVRPISVDPSLDLGLGAGPAKDGELSWAALGSSSKARRCRNSQASCRTSARNGRDLEICRA